eukprot:2266160-Pyramimonas_sp.AAC.1
MFSVLPQSLLACRVPSRLQCRGSWSSHVCRTLPLAASKPAAVVTAARSPWTSAQSGPGSRGPIQAWAGGAPALCARVARPPGCGKASCSSAARCARASKRSQRLVLLMGASAPTQK